MMSKELLDSVVAYEEEAFIANKADTVELYKVYLSSALQYLKLGYLKDCMATLHKVPESFFETGVPSLMESDSLFAADMVDLAYTLEKAGITFEVKISPTQKQGTA